MRTAHVQERAQIRSTHPAHVFDGVEVVLVRNFGKESQVLVLAHDEVVLGRTASNHPWEREGEKQSTGEKDGGERKI